jgi:PKD repeat protein
VTVTLNAAPTVSIQTSANPTEDTPTTFTINVGASAAGSSVRNVTIDYGDGQIDQLGAQTGTITATHIYGSPGTYTVRVNVTDSSGETTPATTVINVAPATPVSVNVTAQPPTPRVRENVIFTANVSPATAQIREYRWDFGDGFNRTTTGNQTNHFYDRVGQRTVTVLAVNVDGRTHRGETEIIVQP